MGERRADEGASGRFGVALLACAAPMLVVAVYLANASGQTAQTLLGPLARIVEVVSALGEQLASLAGPIHAISAIGIGAVLLWAGHWFVRGRPNSATPTGAALALAALGQLYFVEMNPWAAVALYGVGIGIYASRRESVAAASTVPAADPLVMGVTIGCVLAALALFLLLAIHRLDVYPAFYFDEGAYLNAARMQIGSLEPGVIARYGSGTIYSFERFQFQRIPLWIQSTGLLAMQPGLLALRLVSISAMFAALCVAAVGLRRRLGSLPIAGMVAMAAASPLTLGVSRPAFYVSITILHGVLCLLALLRFERRWDRQSALLLGGLLGASLYCYQLSWFVPVLVVAAVASTPELWRRHGAATLGATVAAAAGLMALPGVLAMPEGLQSVMAQTFDKAAWNPTGGVPLGVVVAPEGVEAPAADAFAASHRSAELTASRSTTGERPVVVFYGAEQEVDRALATATAAGWHDLGGEVSRSAGDRVSSIARRLFYQPGWESGGRWIDGSLLNPWFAPLVILGLVEAIRRRSVFALRVLGVWVVVGALLPASIGGAFPRRTVLILPVVFALASLPLADWYRTRQTQLSRILTGGLAVLWLLAGSAFGTHHYLDNWDQRISLGTSSSVLAFDKALNALPAAEPVLAPDALKRNWQYLYPNNLSNNLSNNFSNNSQRARRVVLIRQAADAAIIRSRSCAVSEPFSWVVPNVPEFRERFARLTDDFEIRHQVVGPYQLIRILSRRSGGCQDAP